MLIIKVFQKIAKWYFIKMSGVVDIFQVAHSRRLECLLDSAFERNDSLRCSFTYIFQSHSFTLSQYKIHNRHCILQHILIRMICFHFTFWMIRGSSCIENYPLLCTDVPFYPHGKGNSLDAHIRVMATLGVMVSVVYKARLTICLQAFADTSRYQGGTSCHGTVERALCDITYSFVDW